MSFVGKEHVHVVSADLLLPVTAIPCCLSLKTFWCWSSCAKIMQVSMLCCSERGPNVL